MAANDASPAAFRHLQIDRDDPFAKLGRDRADETLLIGTVDIMTDPAGPSLVSLVDVQLMQVAVAVAEVGVGGAGISRDPAFVAAKTEGITLFGIRGVKTQGDFFAQEGLEFGAVGVMAGDTLAILDRLMR